MRNLINYFINPFKDPGISINEHAAFTTDHLGRLTENPHPQLNGLIAPTSAVMEDFGVSITDDSSKAALRKMRKQMKSNFRPTVTGQIELTMGGVRRALKDAGRPPGEETLYLPNGLSPFTRATDDRLGYELERFAAALADNEDIVGAELVAEGADLLAAWEEIYQNSEQSSAQKSTTEAERRAARDALAVQLNLNLHTLAIVFPEQPEKLGLYMQPALLGGPPLTVGGTFNDNDDSQNSSSSEDDIESSSSSEDDIESSFSSEDDFSSSSSFFSSSSSSFPSSSSSEPEPPSSSSSGL